MDAHTAVKGAQDVRSRIEKNFGDPDKLSDLAVKLAAYNSHIGDAMAELELELADIVTRRHYQYTTDGGLSDSAAEKKIKAELAVDRAKQKALQIAHSDNKAHISTIQSRLKILMQERQYG